METPARESLTVMYRGSEELPGLIFYGLACSAGPTPLPTFPSSAWPVTLEPDALRLHGESWEVIGWEVPILSWPSMPAFASAVKDTLGVLVDQQARVAWVGAEGIPFADPPSLFDPTYMSGGVLAFLTDDGRFDCPLDPERRVRCIGDDDLLGLRAYVAEVGAFGD